MTKKALTLRFLRILALLFLLSGAAGSFYFVINAGRNNNSVLLRAIFIFWVLSPFIVFLFADIISKSWLLPARKILYWLILIVSTGSLIFYSGVFAIPKTKPAFIFLIVPLISLLLIITAILIARKFLRNTNTSSKH